MREVFRHGARSFRQRPGRTALSIGVLALGLGLVTASFSIVDGILWRPLDLPESGELVAIVESSADSPSSLPAEDVGHLRELRSSIDVLAAHLTFYSIVSPGTGPSHGLVGAYVTTDFLDLMGYAPSSVAVFNRRTSRVGPSRLLYSVIASGGASSVDGSTSLASEC